MLKLLESITGTPVLSLQTGRPIASIISPLINPNNLYIEGWHVEDTMNRQRSVLLSNDIREVIPQGFVVNDYAVLTNESDLIRLREILEMRFSLIGLKVTSESGKSYGKISDYAYDTAHSFIQKLYVAQSLVKNFSGGALSIDRSQIIEVTNRRIVIEEPVERTRASIASPVIG